MMTSAPTNELRVNRGIPLEIPTRCSHLLTEWKLSFLGNTLSASINSIGEGICHYNGDSMEMDINPENCVLVKGCKGISIEKLIINFQRRGFVGEFGIDVDDSKSRMVDDDEALLYLTDKDGKF